MIFRLKTLSYSCTGYYFGVCVCVCVFCVSYFFPLSVYNVNNGGPHGRLACILHFVAKCVTL